MSVKRILFAAIAFMILLTFASCGTDNSTETAQGIENRRDTEIASVDDTAAQTEKQTGVQAEAKTEKNEEDKIVIACVGDSITYGYNSTNPKTCSYPTKLGELLGEGYEVLNFGVSSATLINRDEHSYTRMKEYKKSLESDPDIVIIMLGTNDSVYIRNLGCKRSDFIRMGKKMIKAYQELESKPLIFVATPVHAYKDRTDVEEYVEKEIRPAILTLVEDCGTEYIDMWPATEDMDELFPDGIHPSDEGYEKLAKIFYDALNDYFEKTNK